jgi:hypothetical protein
MVFLLRPGEIPGNTATVRMTYAGDSLSGKSMASKF